MHPSLSSRPMHASCVCPQTVDEVSEITRFFWEPARDRGTSILASETTLVRTLVTVCGLGRRV